MPLQGTASGQRQKMNRGETRKRCGGGERKKLFSTSPIIFCLTLIHLFVQLYLFYKTRAKNTPKKQTSKETNAYRRPPHVCPPCHGPTKASKVGVRTNVFFARKWRWSRDHLSSVNALICHFDLRAKGQSFSLCLVITMVNFVIEKKFKWIEIPTHHVTLSLGTLGDWRAEQKVRNLDNFCLWEICRIHLYHSSNLFCSTNTKQQEILLCKFNISKRRTTSFPGSLSSSWSRNRVLLSNFCQNQLILCSSIYNEVACSLLDSEPGFSGFSVFSFASCELNFKR